MDLERLGILVDIANTGNCDKGPCKSCEYQSGSRCLILDKDCMYINTGRIFEPDSVKAMAKDTIREKII